VTNIRNDALPALLCTILAALWLSGCSGDDPVDPGPDDDPYPWPVTADALMANFERAYEELSGAEYGRLLHADFQFMFFGTKDRVSTWNRDEDLAGTSYMFSGNPAADEHWGYRPGVEGITVNTLVRQTEWTETANDDPDFPNSSRAEYRVGFVFMLEGGTNTFTIDCDQIFYAKEVVDGWQLVGQQDVGSSARANEDMTWSTLKWLYRDPDFYQWSETPDELMGTFAQAYGEMSINPYEDILHEDFKFIFIDDVAIWDKADDLASTANMFAGNPGQNPDGSFREGVQSISLNTLIRQTPWEGIHANDPDFPDSERALYQVNIRFTLEGGLNTITVASDQEFYVKAEQIDQGDGTTRTRYFLAGQRDLGYRGKANEDVTWGQVKSLYSPSDMTRARLQEDR